MPCGDDVANDGLTWGGEAFLVAADVFGSGDDLAAAGVPPIAHRAVGVRGVLVVELMRDPQERVDRWRIGCFADAGCVAVVAEPLQVVKEPVASVSAVAARSRRIRGQSSVRDSPL